VRQPREETTAVGVAAGLGEKAIREEIRMGLVGILDLI